MNFQEQIKRLLGLPPKIEGSGLDHLHGYLDWKLGAKGASSLDETEMRGLALLRFKKCVDSDYTHFSTMFPQFDRTEKDVIEDSLSELGLDEFVALLQNPLSAMSEDEQISQFHEDVRQAADGQLVDRSRRQNLRQMEHRLRSEDFSGKLNAVVSNFLSTHQKWKPTTSNLANHVPNIPTGIDYKFAKRPILGEIGSAPNKILRTVFQSAIDNSCKFSFEDLNPVELTALRLHEFTTGLKGRDFETYLKSDYDDVLASGLVSFLQDQGEAKIAHFVSRLAQESVKYYTDELTYKTFSEIEKFLFGKLENSHSVARIETLAARYLDAHYSWSNK